MLRSFSFIFVCILILGLSMIKPLDIKADGCRHYVGLISPQGASIYISPSQGAKIDTKIEGHTRLHFIGEIIHEKEKWYYFNTFMGFRYVWIEDLSSVRCADESK